MSSTLTEQLENLSTRKSHVISEAAKEARLHAEEVDFDSFSGAHTANMSDVELFNENVKVLRTLFQHTRFDEFVVLLGQPQRFIMLSFISGVVRGLGFAVGLAIVIGVVLGVGADTLKAMWP